MTRVTRTYLAVPAHREKMVAGAAASGADAVFMDLEDAVPEASKPEALAGAMAALAHLDWGTKTVAVRVNTVPSGLIEHEIATLRHAPRLDALIIPKTEFLADLALVERFLGNSRIEIEALIETALGLVIVDPNAGAAGRLRGLHFGVGDFAASIGARSADIGESPAGYAHTAKSDAGYATAALDLWTYPMMRILVAARAFGLRAIDGPCGAFRDATLTAAAAVKAAAMGFDGKQVIHPSQIDATRDAFTPGAAEIAFARKVAAAMAAAAAAGLGAVSVDGRLIDAANLRMIERVLAMAGTSG